MSRQEDDEEPSTPSHVYYGHYCLGESQEFMEEATPLFCPCEAGLAPHSSVSLAGQTASLISELWVMNLSGQFQMA